MTLAKMAAEGRKGRQECGLPWFGGILCDRVGRFFKLKKAAALVTTGSFDGSVRLASLEVDDAFFR